MATPIRTVRVPSQLWEAAQAKAAKVEFLTVSDILLDALCQFVHGRPYCSECGGPCAKPTLRGPDDPF